MEKISILKIILTLYILYLVSNFSTSVLRKYKGFAPRIDLKQCFSKWVAGLCHFVYLKCP